MSIPRPAPGTPEAAHVTRRTLLARLGAVLGMLLAGALGVPLVGAAIGPAVRREESRWMPLGPASDYAIGQPRMVTFGVTKTDAYLRTTLQRAVWVYRHDETQLLVYNARCTHLGCLVNFRADSRTFFSPCHAGVFALADGRVLDGPPPRSLDRLEYRVENGQLLVQYRDFLVGVPERVPL
jgi:Rieske Fe-S protein